KLLAVLLSTLMLAACGGGDDNGSAPTPTPTPTPTVVILDSFGRTVFDSNTGGGGSDGVGGGDAGADGSAGDGAPIVNGTVTIIDASNKSVTAKTDAIGYYRAKVTGFTPPLVAKVVKTDGNVRYSLNIKPIVANKFITLNITSLTDKIASDVAIAGGKAGAAQLTPQIVAANTAAIATATNSLASQFSTVITKAGLDIAKFDPLGAPFVANHTGFDNVLDNAVLTKTPTGATVIAVAPVYIPPASVIPVEKPSTLVALPGTWEQTSTAAGSTPDVEIVPGSDVPPSQAALTDFYWVSTYLNMQADKLNAEDSNFKISFSNITMSSTGFSFVFNGVGTGSSAGSSSTMNVRISISNYVGCGSCGVGTSVKFDYSATSSGSYTFNGATVPMATETSTGSVSYLRKS
ncbi:MAG: hypothetical protein ACOYNF_08610, partial [Rhodoferax sp.]